MRKHTTWSPRHDRQFRINSLSRLHLFPPPGHGSPGGRVEGRGAPTALRRSSRRTRGNGDAGAVRLRLGPSSRALRLHTRYRQRQHRPEDPRRAPSQPILPSALREGPAAGRDHQNDHDDDDAPEEGPPRRRQSERAALRAAKRGRPRL